MAVEQYVLTYLLENFEFPKSALFNRVIAKDNFAKNSVYNPAKTKDLLDNVQQINWVFLFKDSNVLISEYESVDITVHEVEYIHVQLKTAEKREEIAKMILMAIPKITFLEILWFEKSNSYHQWYAADYRMKSRSNILEPEAIHKTEVVSEQKLKAVGVYLSFTTQSHLNLLALNKSFIQSIERYNFKQSNGLDAPIGLDVVNTNLQIEQLKKEINRLTISAKREGQMNKRIQLVELIRRNQLKLKSLEEGKIDERF